jgi:hypothetical protein
MINTPKVGSTITVTTKHRNVILGKDPFVFRTFSGVVLSPDKWMIPSEFALATRNKDFPKAVVNMTYVVDIKYTSGSAGAEVNTNTRTFKVTSKSTGKSYIVTSSAGAVACTCTGYSFRRTCSHSVKVANFIKGKA